MSSDRPGTDRELDVRDIDGEPFVEIMDAVADLSPHEGLLLINSFEPQPVYRVLEERGFTYETTNPESERWHVEIRHD